MTGPFHIDREQFAPLPRPRTAAGDLRRTGVEIELAGLTEAEAARIAQGVLGGEIRERDAHRLDLEGSAIGGLKIYLDTRFRDREGALARIGLDMARAVVPIEIVTKPLAPEDLPRLDRLRAALREAGAEGSGKGALYGFGLHLNPEIAGPELADLLPTLTAYALLEDWLRLGDPMDPSRRLLPFSDPYPRAFVDALVTRPPGSLAALIDLYLEHSPTRNRGLDMLPAFAHLDPDRVARVLTDAAISARPTWHYRLPDSRIDAETWSIAYEWNRWALVERVGADPVLLAALGSEWRDHRAGLFETRGGWCDHVADRLAGREAPA